MRACLAATERFAVHLRPEDVYAALTPASRPADLDAVTQALDKLVEWGNLRADPDHARVTAVEDFYRRRFIYQLTRAGEAAEAALGMYDEGLGRRGELQVVALHDIVTQLRALQVIAAEDAPDDAELAHWAERIRGDGLVRRLAHTPEAAAPLVEAAVRALRALPVSPPTSRATFAARNLSGAHTLDEGRRSPLSSCRASVASPASPTAPGCGGGGRRGPRQVCSRTTSPQLSSPSTCAVRRPSTGWPTPESRRC